MISAKPSNCVRWSNALRRWIGLFFLSVTTGCGQSPRLAQHSAQKTSAQAEFADQLAQIRAGKSTTLATTTPLKPAERRLLRDLATLESLELQGDPWTDADLENLPISGRLRKIVLVKATFSADGFVSLARQTSLESLNLPATCVDDAGVFHLSQLKALQLFRADASTLSETGVKRLTELPSLRFLILINAKLTAKGIEAFEAPSALESLYLVQGEVDEAAWTRLGEKRPQLHLHR